MVIDIFYDNYHELRRTLKNRTYVLTNDSIGTYRIYDYSVDITVREYDDNWCIDYDIYKSSGKQNKSNKEMVYDIYLDGGKVCDVSKIPITEKAFWKLILKKFKKHIFELKLIS